MNIPRQCFGVVFIYCPSCNAGRKGQNVAIIPYQLLTLNAKKRIIIDVVRPDNKVYNRIILGYKNKQLFVT